jgi:hypothetical protein
MFLASKPRRVNMSNWEYPDKNQNDDIAIIAVIDASGSMDSLKTDTIGSFNGFKREQTSLPGKAYMSVTLFNTNVKIHASSRDIKEVPDLSTSNYVPNGGTALYDAVGKTIQEVSTSKNLPPKVLFLIITDGEENSSREYSQSIVKNLIADKTNQGWQFVFLGANQDKWAASNIGVTTFGAYASTPAGTHNLFNTVSASTTLYRSSGSSVGSAANMNWNSTDDLNNPANSTVQPEITSKV